MATSAMAAPSDAERLKAAAAAGCEVSQDRADRVSLAPWPAEPGLLAVAVLEGEASEDDLGTLCVAALRKGPSGFVKVAALASDEIAPPSGINVVTSTSVQVDGAAYRFRPGEAALGVVASGETNTTSTNYATARLYLFRRVGARLVSIFDREIAEDTVDKTTGDEAHHGGVVRVDRRTTNGAFDLIVARKGGADGVRYAWNGARYVRAGRHAKTSGAVGED